ncbi:MAG TPA: V-type ATP synthase subunit D [Clostridiaceae bacterium]|jgi:V/A-type H+-transporting ATPase subunit D|nr:V-type ATP synthase subunit D [Clostridiaceae bacterium]
MGMRNLPTKNNLIKLKSFINQSKEGKKLLEQKKLILQREMDKYIKERKELKKRGENLLKEAFESLKNANVDIGIERVADIANGIEKDDSLDIKYISVMGVEIPSVVIGEKEQKINFGLYETTVAMDEAIVKFQEVKEYLVNFAQIETTITRLKASIEKVERRINALEQVIIPRDEKIAKKISDILDETEMEEFARLKIVKKDKKE